MDENLINQIAENDELDDVIIQDVDIPMQDVIPEIVTEEIIDDISITTDDIEIDISESMGWVTGDNRYHNSLLGIDAPNQHPITAITGLRDELDEIEALKTVFSNQNNHADYYLWRHENAIPNEPDGLFVSFYPSTNSIQVCSDTDDIFGVTVKSAGFIGGQNDIPRDNKYGLVVCAGVVSVRCELDVVTGDSVVSNSYGYAKKAEGGYGYKVISVQKIDGVTYATIPLGISVNQVNDLMIEFDAFDTRVNKVETDIVAAINVAQQAYNKAGEANSVSQEALKEALDAVLKSDEIVDKNKDLENIVTSTNQVAVQAKAIAESAVTTAESIRLDAEKAANDTLASVNDLIEDLEPITTWSYTDPATGKQYEGAEYLANYIKDDLATKAEVYTVESLTEENKSLIEKNAESFTTFVSSVDKYSVGEYSQSYGLTREQAISILKNDTIYVPTKHKDSDSHSETFVGESEKQWFTPGSHYKWDGNDWIEYGNSVAFGINEPSYTSQLQYWYIDSDTAPEGYEPYTLYAWVEEQWQKVNILIGNANNRISSITKQMVDEVALEVVNARGGASSLNVRIEDTESKVNSYAYWPTEENNRRFNLSTIDQSANGDGSKLTLAVIDKDGDNIIKGATIVLNQDEKGSFIQLDASVINFTAEDYNVISENINLSGYVTIEGVENGTTVINGSCIQTGTIQSNNYEEGETGLKIVLDDGTMDSKNFKINSNGDVELTGTIKSESGKIGPWEIGKTHIYSGKESIDDDDTEGVYIGEDGISIGNGTNSFTVSLDGQIGASTLLKWSDGTTSSFAEMKQQVDKNGTSIEQLVGYRNEDLNTMASIKSTADENKSNIDLLTKWQGEASTSLTSIEQKATKNEASINSLVSYKDDINSSIANISEKVDENGASISSLTEWKDETNISIAGIEQKVDENSASISSLALWTDGIDSSMASIQQQADENGASIGLVVENGNVKGGIIIDAINGETSATIEAERINLKGYVTVSSLGAEGATTIHGNRIETGTLSADRLESHSITTDQLDVDKITLGGWSITDEGFRSSNDDNVYMYASGLLGCQRIVVNNVSLAGVMDLNDYSNINTPITKGVGGLDAYLDNLRARIAALEKHTNVGHKVHTYSQLVSRTPATCTADGSETYKCSCGATTTKPLLKISHEWNANGICIVCKTERTTETCEHPAWKVLYRKEPTCDDDGEELLQCTECGYIPDRTTLPAGHSWGNEDGVCWRCKQKCDHEFDGGVICTICGYNELHSQHTYIVTSYEQVEGSSVHRPVYTCACGKTYTGGLEECTYDENGVCIQCGSKQESICEHPAWTTLDKLEPTCDTDGYEISECTECGYQQRVELSAGHSWVDGVCERCETECSHEFDGDICSICGYVISENPCVNGHNYTYGQYHYDTESNMHTQEYTCTVCGLTGNTSPQGCEFDENGYCVCGNSDL